MDQQDNNPNTGPPNKHLYTFIKQQKSDSSKINSLKSNGINYTLPTDKAKTLKYPIPVSFHQAGSPEAVAPCLARTSKETKLPSHA